MSDPIELIKYSCGGGSDEMWSQDMEDWAKSEPWFYKSSVVDQIIADLRAELAQAKQDFIDAKHYLEMSRAKERTPAEEAVLAHVVGWTEGEPVDLASLYPKGQAVAAERKQPDSHE